ncbi:uncharacterized protein J7T54_005273 [Emericellopsis cladophorae]|uniref:Aconitate hydratase, mitochondrial n=1 Tax=Emericellopsis cladophorae TaxID=2686198 RepID=A0A9Q0BD72_9HYPO|nr:uncharacterized protein J7T54_005273 [Emericellopsis cladophorae]KAI6781562.1 hypothetical protein J7T54_005273 [Emericellopsis cladophorae]
MEMLGIGVVGSDAVDAMASLPDIICKLAGILSVSGGKGKILELIGPGVRTLDATAMAAICNTSAEVGSSSCIFPYSESTGRYLSATRRDSVARYAESFKESLLTADEDSNQYCDEVIHNDLTTLEPHINGPFTPDLHHSLPQFKAHIQESSWPSNTSHSMVGSPTAPAKISRKFKILSNRPKKLKEKCSVISSFNQNSTSRRDGNPATYSFVTSPEIFTAFAYAGDLSSNPSTDLITVVGESGVMTDFRFTPPTAEELPDAFVASNDMYQSPVLGNADQYRVEIDENSERLGLLEPFPAWKNGRAREMQVLVNKVAGKCATDRISPDGPWYNYRGHLTNISHNMVLGASNSFLPDNTILDMIGKTKDPADGDNNYGEGSSREHAILEPRLLDGTAVIVRSFARIHETNLKKQGMLLPTFDGHADYGIIQEADVITLLGVDGKKLQSTIMTAAYLLMAAFSLVQDTFLINAHGCVIYNEQMYVVTNGGPNEIGQLFKIDSKTLKKEVLLNDFCQQPFQGFNKLDIDRDGNSDSEHKQVISPPGTGASDFKPFSQKSAFGNRDLYAFDVAKNRILTNQRLLNNPIAYF